MNKRELKKQEKKLGELTKLLSRALKLVWTERLKVQQELRRKVDENKRKPKARGKGWLSNVDS